LVTVALENWQFNCWRLAYNSARPSRGGFVRLRTDATRLPVVLPPGKSCLPLVRNLTIPVPSVAREKAAEEKAAGELPKSVAHTSTPVLPLEHASSEYSAGGALYREKESRPDLFSAFLVSR